MISPIDTRSKPVLPPFAEPRSFHTVEERKKKEEASSLYYVTTMKSLAASQQQNDTLQPAVDQVKNEESQKSLLGRAKEWFWNLFGFGKQEPATYPVQEEKSDTVPLSHLFDHTPSLEKPGEDDDQRLSRAIVELNREMVNRLKDIAEFEEEMRKASSKKLDKLIFVQLVASTQTQRKLKEDSGLLSSQEVFVLHEKNKALQAKYYSLLDEINSRAKTNKVLNWINLGSTVGLMGIAAITFATAGAGAILAAGIPFLSLTKGAVSMIEGISRYKSDKLTGEMYLVSRENKYNTADINEEMSTMQSANEDIGALLKEIRHLIDNQGRAERGSFGRNA